MVDLRPEALPRADEFVRTAMVGRMQKLERLALAEPVGPMQWRLSETAEPVMRALLGERGMEGARIAASGGFAAIGIAIGMSVWRAREAKTITMADIETVDIDSKVVER